MSDPKKITAETVKAAVRDAKEGRQYDLTDPQCPGLQLRVRGGAVTWAVRARLFGTQRRWIVGGPEIKPDIARGRAGEVKGWCQRDQDPKRLVTQFVTGISIAHQLRVSGEHPPPSWCWQQAVDKFMEHIQDHRTAGTYDDYARTLGGKRRLARRSGTRWCPSSSASPSNLSAPSAAKRSPSASPRSASGRTGRERISRASSGACGLSLAMTPYDARHPCLQIFYCG
jgi:hypothetical protein